jgi:hypothetical protein
MSVSEKNNYKTVRGVLLSALVVPLFAWFSGVAVLSSEVSAVSQVNVTADTQVLPIIFNVTDPADGAEVGQTFDVTVSGQNVDTVDVYLNNVLYGTWTVGSDGAFGPQVIGTVDLGASADFGDYQLKLVAHSKEGTTQTATINQTVEYVSDAPRVDSVNPLAISTEGGETVTIRGRNFTGATVVQVGGVDCESFTVIDDNTITCVTAPHPSGMVDVSVTTDKGSYTAPNLIRYIEPGGGVLPPNTGLFYLGNMVVTSYDMFAFFAVMLAAGVLIFMLVVKHSGSKKKTAGRKTVAVTAARPVKSSTKTTAKKVAKKPVKKQPVKKTTKKAPAKKSRSNTRRK